MVKSIKNKCITSMHATKLIGILSQTYRLTKLPRYLFSAMTPGIQKELDLFLLKQTEN